MKSIDVKSLLIGILGTALLMVLMGQTNKKNEIGLYQLSCGGEECVVINSKTGRAKYLYTNLICQTMEESGFASFCMDHKANF